MEEGEEKEGNEGSKRRDESTEREKRGEIMKSKGETSSTRIE